MVRKGGNDELDVVDGALEAVRGGSGRRALRDEKKVGDDEEEEQR